MKRIDLDIYRQHYGGGPLKDIWDKISNVLEERGLHRAPAEYAGLLITEWIRTTWGGLMLTERHGSDPKDYSRFDLLRDQAMAVLAEIAPHLPHHAAVAAEIVRAVRVDYRGKYITKIKRLNLLQRDQDIWRRANTPAQIEQLAIEHGLSVVRAYQINRDMQNHRDKREQMVLEFE